MLIPGSGSTPLGYPLAGYPDPGISHRDIPLSYHKISKHRQMRCLIDEKMQFSPIFQIFGCQNWILSEKIALKFAVFLFLSLLAISLVDGIVSWSDVSSSKYYKTSC